jgi:hypothetical protein
MSQISKILKEWIIEGIHNSDILETEYFEINEIKIDPLNTYNYKEINLPHYTKSYIFTDRCGNKIVATYIESVGEFKTGYKVKDSNTLIFQPELNDNIEDIIRPCPDDKKVGTIYKILKDEIIPDYLLNKKPNKITFNPVSESRNRLVSILLSKIIKYYPQLIVKNNYLIYK